MDIVFSRRFSVAHRLLQCGSEKCQIPHGHNEIVKARVSYIGGQSLDSESNIAADFADLKTDWHRWIDNSVDHTFHLGDRDPLINYFETHEPQRLSRLLVTPGDPSTECLAALFLCKYQSFLGAANAPFEVSSIELIETPTNTVEIRKADISFFPGLSTDGWWRRADSSINNFELANNQAASRSAKASLTSV